MTRELVTSRAPSDHTVTAAVGDAEQLPFRPTSFDVVVCGFGLQFMYAPDLAIAEMRRVLRRGGRMAMSVPAGMSANWDF